jgi:hypothetical protein
MADKRLNIKIRTDGAKKAKGALGGVDRSMKTLAKSAVVAAGSFYALKKAFDFTVELKNFARDAEETTNKFKTVFSSMESAATKTAKTLAASFGLAHSTAMELLGDTGDLLVGFGFTEKSALELSKNVNELAIDLASFTNFSGGAEGASLALTKALLGERESIKSLGIAITEADLKGFAADQGLVWGELDRVAKAQVTYELALKQSSKASGDFARTQDDLANQERILSEKFKELKEDLGTALLPAFQDLTTWLGKAAEKAGDFFLEMTETSLQTSIRELQSLGVNTLNLELAFAKAEAAKVKYLAVGLREEEEISANLENSANARVDLMINLAKEQAELLDSGKNEDSLRKEILDKQSLLSLRTSETGAAVKREARETIRVNEAKLAEIDLLKQLIADQEVLIGKDQEDLEIIKKSEAAKEHILALEKAILENKKNQSEIPPPKSEGGDGGVIDALIMTEEQKASIRAEYNERFLEMTKGSYELQSIELDNAVKRFDKAGIEEREIARFTKEVKEQLYLDTAQSFASSVAGNLAIMTKAGMITGKEAKRAAQVQAIVDTYAAANAAYKAMAGIPVIGPGLGAFAAATAIAAGIANVRMIESQSFAQGGDFVTSGPQMIAVGDNPGGRERVQVTPLSSPNIDGPQGGITINISAPLVDETVIDSIIPAIEKAQRLNLA